MAVKIKGVRAARAKSDMADQASLTMKRNSVHPAIKKKKQNKTKDTMKISCLVILKYCGWEVSADLHFLFVVKLTMVDF